MSKTASLLILFGLNLAIPARCGDGLEARILAYPKEVPVNTVGVKVQFEIRNVSGKPITVVSYPSFEYHFKIWRADGKPRMMIGEKPGELIPCAPSPMDVDYFDWAVTDTLPADWRVRMWGGDDCVDEPGELIAQAVVYNKKPFLNDRQGKPLDETGIWVGESRSAEVHIKLVEPTGVDLEIQNKYKTWKPDERSKIILEKYPFSTYAAYMLWGGAYSSSGGYDGSYPYLSRPENPEDDYQLGQKYKSEYQDCPKCVSGSFGHYKKIVESWERLILNFPDFPYRKQALYGLVRSYFFAGTPEKAAPILKELTSQFPGSDEAKKATGYMDSLKVHGLCKK